MRGEDGMQHEGHAADAEKLAIMSIERAACLLTHAQAGKHA